MTYRTKEELEKFCVKENTSLKKGLKIMDSLRQNVIFITDKNNTFIGILTDGDFRRAILAGIKYSDPISTFVNRNPITIDISHANNETIKTVLISKNIRHLPVLENGYLRDIVFKTDLQKEKEFLNQEKEKLENPVVIMAGGKGTRLDPFTRILPKPLLPIGEKTVLEVIIERFLEYQVEDFYLTVNYKSIVIKSYFEELKPDYNIHYVEEEEPLGTAGALKFFENQFEKPIIVTNCDILIDAYYSDLVRHHVLQKNDITMVASIQHYHIPYGICEIENGGELKEIKEKPEYSFLVNTGMYVVNPSVLSLIPNNTFFHITNLMEKVKKEGGKVGLYPITENDWIDVGEWDEFLKAVNKINI